MWAAVAALLFAYATMSFTASLSKGVSFDEGLQLAAGYNIWRNHDLRIEGANGDFIKRWATLPYLLSQPNFVRQDDPLWQKSLAYDLGWKFFFEVGNRPEALLRQSRAMIVLLGVATGLLVFWCSRELFGVAGGFISLAIFVFSPSMLALGAIVSTDMSITLALFASTCWIWRLLHAVSPGRVLASLGWIGVLVLAKPTALVIFPITALMLAVRLLVGRPLVVTWHGTEIQVNRRVRQAAIIAALGCLHVGAAWGALWAHYEFRYAASPQPENSRLELYRVATPDEVPAAIASTVSWLRRTHFLPEGFLNGINALLECDDHLAAFMNGQWKLGGWASFFPYTIWVKTPLAVLLLVALGAVGWARLARARAAHETERAPGLSLYAATPHLALIGCYLAIAMTEDLNIGHRHVLPIYPSLDVLAGAAVFAWPRQRRWVLAVSAGLLGWLTIESFAIRPHYLAYFGPQAGGPSQGYKHLVDSSLGWGMNLPVLKRWLDEHVEPSAPVLLAYFGNDDPAYYGIKAKRLPGYFDRRGKELCDLTPGYYVISASIFQGVHTAAFGPWSKTYEEAYRASAQRCAAYAASASNPAQRAELFRQNSFADWMNEFDRFENLRFARLCAWLRHQGEPPHHIGHSLFIWKLDAAAIHAALDGPPVELEDRPWEFRRFREFAPGGQ